MSANEVDKLQIIRERLDSAVSRAKAAKQQAIMAADLARLISHNSHNSHKAKASWMAITTDSDA